MKVNSKEMAGVPVETRSGWPVGRVASFDFDADSGHLQTLRVKPSGLVANLLGEELLVSWDAIVSMSFKKVVITDASVPERARAIAKAEPAAPSAMLKEG
ncbi:hypothetical protein COX00_03635 [Candidatus Uhrbacteria bacterium CG22_combo_CG10-13_8_21_14_all_47_17]|uniref:PRC-barrel domain-containing protein n=1 Tax=Candidatus Uhrbacteria bacterium CG22_combo_CG10-13_8_21_14_all_47_17 TaxID=1975041 RepID=A0A2H0BTR8_9BACT|nr:MAG: hypothetical protein COX00_03635 [Candidatus Uhrbacteria bacterium CG22_combo_CG10-13_8_21_14_all_47_17]